MTKKRLFRSCLCCLAILLFAAGSLGWAQVVSDEARRHFDYGMAAVEMARSPDDYESAIKEFKQVAKLAPDWADVYYNLGMVLEKTGNYEEAAQNLKQYLRLAPNDSDSETVKSLINKLEFKARKISEQARIPELLEGSWMGFFNFCGGSCNEIRFYNFGDGLLSVEIPTTWDADRAQRSDYQRIPVEIEGQNIRFGFKAKFLVPALNITSYCNMRYELKLIASNKLQGKQSNDVNTGEVNFVKVTK